MQGRAPLVTEGLFLGASRYKSRCVIRFGVYGVGDQRQQDIVLLTRQKTPEAAARLLVVRRECVVTVIQNVLQLELSSD